MDIHNYEERLERALENIKKCSRVNPKNRELMLRFIEYKRAQGTSAGRCAKILWTLKKFAIGKYERRGSRSKDATIMKDFDQLTKQDIQREFAKLENSSLKENTKRDYKVIVRFFMSWVLHEKTGSPEPYDPKEHGYPPIFKGIRIKEPRETLRPSDLLTDEEKQRMIATAKNLRDKALIACLDETGIRPGELLSLRVGNVTIENECGRLSLNGKTGIRDGYLIRNLSYLVQWLDSYDQRDNPQAWLWPDFEKPGEPLSYAGLRQMLKRVAEKAGVRKRVYPYIFRHASATSDSTEITEPIMRMIYGWSKNSKVPSRYEHLSGKHAKLAKLKQAGIVVQEGEVKIRLCPRCKKPNPAKATMCHACGSVLSVRLAVEIQKERDSLKKDVEELKQTLNTLLGLTMKPGQRREEILALVESKKNIVRELAKEGYVVEK